MITLVNATDLHQWSERIEAQSFLPRVIRRLILANTHNLQNISKIDFPTDEAVQMGGWDGYLVTSEKSTFVPVGVSVWEFSTNAKVKAKADSDYEKRKADSLNINPSSSTYVFATSRRWGGKKAWAQARKKEGFWADVQVYDADDLETWLESTPNVHTWLSLHLGTLPANIQSLESYGLAWQSATSPTLSKELLLSGREDTCEVVLKQLHGDPSLLELKAEHRDEAVAVVAAIIQNLPDADRDTFFAKSFIVFEQDALQQLASHSKGLILIP
ncbi:MAG: hypothetical protein AAF708_12665 [Deinococcota bacterium]